MSLLLKLIKSIVILIVVLLITAVVFISVFDANEYKPEIIEQVKRSTGRDLKIEGDIELTLYPWIGVSIANVEMGNAQGFSSQAFALIEKLNVKVNVLPLLKKKIEINKVQLHGMALNLEIDETGKTNWQDLAAGQAASESKPDITEAQEKPGKTPVTSTAEQNFELDSLRVEGIDFLGAMIRFTDKAAGRQSKISELNLRTGAIQVDNPVDIIFHARLENNLPALDGQLDLATALTFNKELSVFALRDLLLTVALKKNEMIPQDVQLELKTQANIDLSDQVAQIKKLHLNVLDVSSHADIKITQLLETPSISGTFSIDKFNARVLSKKLGIKLPPMTDNKTLTSVALSTKLKMSDQRLDLDTLSIELDNSLLSGWVHVLNIATQQLRYDLSLNSINLNDYLPPTTEEPANKEQTAAAPEKTTPEVDSTQKTTDDIPIVLPKDLIKTLDVQGIFAITTLHILDYDVTDISIATTAKNGKVTSAPIKLKLLEGNVNARIALDVTQELSKYDITMNTTDIHAGPVVNPILQNLMPDKPMNLKGSIYTTAAVKTQGESLNALKQAANGKVTLDMKHTEINGFDPEYFIRSSVADYLEAKGMGSVLKVRSDYQPREVTAFDVIRATAIIDNGKVTTNDFLMDSKRAAIKAEGSADIMQNSMDMTSSMQLKRGKTSLEKILENPLSVRVYGPFEKLQFKLDTKSLSGALSNQLKQKAKAKVDALKAKAKADAERKLAAEKQRLKDKAEAEKQRLKGKADAEKQKLKDKLQDKLKDKFKGLF